MPYTIFLYASRKPGSTSAEFKKHWENQHIPLLQSISGADFPLSSTRHYIKRFENTDDSTAGLNGGHANPRTPAAILVGSQEDFDFDGFAVLTFRDEAHFQVFFSKVMEPDAAAKIAADEELFLDRSKLKVALIDEVTVTKVAMQ